MNEKVTGFLITLAVVIVALVIYDQWVRGAISKAKAT